MDRAYEGEATGKIVAECSFDPVVQPKSNRLNP